MAVYARIFFLLKFDALLTSGEAGCAVAGDVLAVSLCRGGMTAAWTAVSAASWSINGLAAIALISFRL